MSLSDPISLCAAQPSAARPSSDAPYIPNARCGVWLADGGSWGDWTLHHVKLGDERLRLSPQEAEPGAPALTALRDVDNDTGIGQPPFTGEAAGTPTPSFIHGSAVGPEVETDYPFTDLVASWNAQTPPGARVEVQSRVRIGQHWSRWFVMGRWGGPGGGSSVDGQRTPDGRVDVDTLFLSHPAEACQARVFFRGTADSLPAVSLVGLCWHNPAAPRPSPPDVQPGWARVLEVPRFSQAVQPTPRAGAICSPTSLSMVLSYWGKACHPMDAVAGVYDHAGDMYGNWPMNTAYAGARGCQAYVARFWCLEQIQNEIVQGRPVEASIRFSHGELAGAPINSTDGHLVVVVGFTPEGDVVVNDPAARGADTVQRIYQRHQFESAWQKGSGGIVYLIAPRA